MYIYGLIDKSTNLLRYVGKTQRNNLLVRKNEHLYNSRRRVKSRVHCWIKSIKCNFEIVPIANCSSLLELNELEIYYIKYFRCLGNELTNLTDGGEGRGIGLQHSEETRKKISAGNLGVKKPGTGIALRGRKRPGLGFKPSIQQKIHKSRISGGKPIVDQYGNYYYSVSSLCKNLNLDERRVRAVLNKKPEAKTTGGFVFNYVNDPELISRLDSNPNLYFTKENYRGAKL